MGKYYCKTCQIFVDDNKIATKHHQDSQRHKSGIQRSIWKIHKKNREDLKDKKHFRIVKAVVEGKKGQKEEKEEIGVQIGEWEDVNDKTDGPSNQTKVKAGNDIPKVHSKEKWKLTTKTIQLSDDEDSKPVTFKKRIKKST